MTSETPQGFYRDGDGTLRRQHDVYGGPHDEPPAGTGAEDDGLSGMTWMQLRQCTRIALYYLRGQARDEYLPAKNILARMEQILTEGSTDPVTAGGR